MSEQAMTTAAIGETERPIPAAKFNGNIMLKLDVPSLAERVGINFAMGKNAALPEPIKIARKATKSETTIVM